MQRPAAGGALVIILSALIVTESFVPGAACAASTRHPVHHRLIAPTVGYSSRHGGLPLHRAYWRGISCVPYAREVSGIDLPGNARDWWRNAAGVYGRGEVPQPGAVLAFRAIARMPLGHVAVVSRVINPREIEVNQANWGNGGRVTHDVAVVDVSEENDWSAVRVEIGSGPRFGDIYPTYGFIYHQPNNATYHQPMNARVLASNGFPAAGAAFGWVTSVEVRAVAQQDTEVAEAPPVERHSHRRAVADVPAAQKALAAR
jgi:CHAP domain